MKNTLHNFSKNAVLFLLLGFFFTNLAISAPRYAVANGNWNATSTWSTTSGGAPGASVPAGSDAVSIGEAGARTVTITANALAQSIIISSGSTLTVNGFTLGVSGTTTVSGTITFTSATNPGKTFTGLVTINAGGVWNETAAITPLFSNGSGGITNNGTFTASTGLHTFNTATVAGNLSIPSITIGGGQTLSNNGTFSVTTSLTGGGNLNNNAGGTINLSGSSSIGQLNNIGANGIINLYATAPANGINVYNNSGTTGMNSVLNIYGPTTVFNSGNFNVSTSTPNTVNYAGAAQTVLNRNHYHVVLSGSGNKTINSGTTITPGNLSITGTAVANIGAGLLISSAGSLTLGGVNQILGTWGSTASTATNKNNTYFTATTGRLNVVANITETIWNGTAWSKGTPTSAFAAIIDGTYGTTANGAITANKLTVNSGRTLTINSNTNVTIQNEVINNATAAGLTIQNNANLIQVNNVANTGNITVNRNSSSLFRLDYTMWSSPVTNASQFLTTFSPLTSLTPFIRFYNYNTSTNLFNAVSSPSSTPFATAAGYLIRMPDTDASYPAAITYPGVFTGVANNGNIPVTLNYVDAAHAFNMVGNPYPSTLNAETFIDLNAANIEGTLYFWRKTNGATGSAYATYTDGGATTTTATSDTPNGTIQVGQGFLVRAKSAGLVSALFTNAMRTNNNANQFFKTKNTVERSRVWLNLTNTTGAFSQALVGYMADATLGVDRIDGKYINDSPIALTSNINGEEYTIQGRPAFDVTDVVALNFKTDVAGDYTIALDHFDGLFASGQDVYLKDNSTGAETDLKAGSYTFAATAGVDNTRFSLIYQKTLKVDAPAFNENSVRIYKNNGSFYVNSGNIAIKNIKVFDIQGRLIAEQNNVKATSAAIHNLKAKNQVLIVKIVGEDNNVVTKKVVN